jgi:hypothetical protein
MDDDANKKTSIRSSSRFGVPLDVQASRFVQEHMPDGLDDKYVRTPDSEVLILKNLLKGIVDRRIKERVSDDEKLSKKFGTYGVATASSKIGTSKEKGQLYRLVSIGLGTVIEIDSDEDSYGISGNKLRVMLNIKDVYRQNAVPIIKGDPVNPTNSVSFDISIGFGEEDTLFVKGTNGQWSYATEGGIILESVRDLILSMADKVADTKTQKLLSPYISGEQ